MNTITQTPRVIKKYEPKYEPLTKAQRELIGQLLVEILEDAITEETRKEICALKVRPFPCRSIIWWAPSRAHS